MRKTNLIFAMILLPFVFLACGRDSGQSDSRLSDGPQYASFRDIPGVTEDEIRAIEALQKEYSSFVYGMTLTTETFVDSLSRDGEIKGYSALFCEWLTALFGITFKPALYNWGDLFAGLASREIDFTGDLMATEERRQILFMTDPIAERSLKYFQIAGRPNIYEIARSRPPRLAFLNASAVLDPVSEAVDYDFEVVFVENFIAAYYLMKDGGADALMVMGIVEASFDEFGDVRAETFLPQVFNSASMSTQNPKLQPVISVVHKALQDYHTRRYLSRLHNNGYHEYLKNKLITQFTAEERAYLQNRHVVPVGVDPGNYPGSFYDRRDRQWKGIFFDLLNEVSSLTGLNFERVNDEHATWPVILQMLSDGEALMIPELIHTKERDGLFLWPSTSQMTDYYTLISKSDYPNIQIEDIIHYKIGLTRNTSYTAIFRKWFPNQPGTVEYQSMEDAFSALQRGEIDMVMANQIRLLYLTHYMELPGYKANLVFDQPIDIQFGINRDEAVLCSIIDKALKMVNTKGITDQWMRRTYDYRIKVADAQRPWFIGSSVLFLSAFALVAVLLVRYRRAGKQLKLQAEAVLAASKAKGIFLAHMSHEIRTPLNAIIGMSYILKNSVDDNDNEKALRSVNQIITSSHHLMEILNDILDMSKIESGKLELTYEPFSLLTACGEVSDIMTHRCVEKNITFITNIHEIKDIILTGDKLRLNQVLINLLSNAVKFTDTNGKITFIAEIIEDGAEKAHIQFSISDNGIGMSEDQIEKLFIPFEQADSTIAGRFGGTGLGLSLSQNFVNMMGGTISVTSEINNGSRFDFSLYFDKGELPESQTMDDKEKYENMNLSGKRLLLAEDIEINRLIVCELLSLSGLSIDEVENGRQAVDAFAASPQGYYDIIMMDIQMPVLDGYEAAREIRALDRADAKTVSIIAMTANAYKEDVQQALAAGMNGHLAKPIDKPALMETVGKILNA